MTKDGRKRRSPEEWRTILMDYETAPAVDDAFFERIGVNRSVLYKNRTRLGFKHERGNPKNLARLEQLSSSGGEAAANFPGRRKSKYPEALRNKAVELYRGGKGATAIAHELKMPGKKGVAMVQYWITRSGPRQELLPATVTATPKAMAPAREPSAMGDGAAAAISLLKQFEREAMRLVRTGKIAKLDSAHLLGILALRSLTGD